MADDTNDVLKKLDDMRQQASARLEEARAIVANINTVETIFDLPLTTLTDLETAALTTPPPEGLTKGSAEPGNALQKRRSPRSIRPDEYLGEEPMKAAKRYMASIGHAVPFDDIADAVQRGGAAIQGTDWRDRLELSLKRSPYEVVTVAEKTYGLREFYTPEQMNRLKASRRGSPAKPLSAKPAKKKTPGRPKGRPKGRPSQVAAKASQKPKKAMKDSIDGTSVRKKPGRPRKNVEAAKIEDVASEHVH